MTRQEVKQVILHQCAREKRIVLRNIILVAILATIVLALLWIYALPNLILYNQQAIAGVASSDFGVYYKWAIPVGLLLSLIYPAKKLFDVFQREKNTHKVFDMLQQNTACTIVSENKAYLTTIPLHWIKIRLNPVHYLHISLNDRGYELPVVEELAPEIKRVLSQADLGHYESIMDQLYGDAAPAETEDAPVKKQPPAQPLPSLTDFHRYAEAEFSGQLKDMEQGRGSVQNIFVVQVFIALAFVGTMVWFFVSGGSAMTDPADIFKLMMTFVGFSSVVGVGYYFFYKRKISNGNTNFTAFKKSVFSRLVHYINPGFEYIEKAHIGLREWLHAGLFTEENYSITGGDQIIGMHNGVPFQSCNLTVTYRPNFTSERDPDDCVFSGNYFVARFHKTFPTPIYIHPRKGVFGAINDSTTTSYLNTEGNKILLEDPDFQEQFNVYCDDQVVARYVLTPVMMERLKAINKRNKGKLYMAINQNNIVMATNSENATEVGNAAYGMMFTKIDLALLDRIYQELTEQLAMIDTLKLNQALWKK
ncbi:DUF3137 domain-containing protein [Dawidia soli]|uniref:DUF3137 domain-containing protein n=1 Tax=Dawidia soli TaxID=2782352 RepID=A0AAP2D798_9BACT|nr:DUF3137 domain-containing protein [Dawidia soli]MBT1686414.1 DUF3137 domain-containing protein [Dawidia soli]